MSNSITIMDGQSMVLVAENVLLSDDASMLQMVEIELVNPQDLNEESIDIDPVSGSISLNATGTTMRLLGPATQDQFTAAISRLSYRYSSMSSLIMNQPNTATRYILADSSHVLLVITMS